MKTFSKLAVVLALSVPAFVSGKSATEPEEAAKRMLRELRGSAGIVVRARELESQLRADVAPADGRNGWLGRRKEFSDAQQSVTMAESAFASLPTKPGSSLTWAPDGRIGPATTESAKEFLTGPGGVVSPWNGELILSFTDIDLPARAGLGFSFHRTYSSLETSDRGMGPGWECNWTPRLVFAVDEDGSRLRCDVRLGGRSFSFVRQGDNWIPPADVFLDLEVENDSISILSPERLRWTFERSAETPDGWRLRSIATRHDDWKANRLEVRYQNGSDRIGEVVDPFDRKVRFAYDDDGHIAQVATPFFAILYRYEERTGLLLETETSPIVTAIDRLPKPIRQTFRYEQSGAKGWRLCEEQSSTMPNLTTTYGYDAKGRVASCTETAADASRAWTFRYDAGVTIVAAPFPTPETVYRYGSAPHPSLPDSVEIPARNAKTSYEWTQSFLPTRETDPVGVATIRRYDETNPVPSLRGNLLSEKVLPAAGRHADWKEIGTETDYVAGTALPAEEQSYQIAQDGTRTILKTERWEYSPDGDPTFHDDGGLVHTVAYNRFGLPALEKDGNENVSVHYYAAAFPEATVQEFQTGSPANGGPEVLLVEDANWKQMSDAGKAVGLKGIFRTDHNDRSPAVSRETKTAWTPWGDEIRRARDREETLTVRNVLGMVLAECELGRSLVVTEFRPGGEPETAFHLFDPPEESFFKGNVISRFNGLFFAERFEYDGFLALSGRSPTDEKVDETVPRFAYERHPSGKMSAIVNPGGIRREDRYDAKTGWLESQRIVGKTESALLYKVFKRYPNGEVLSWEDSFGGVWTNLLDGFGRVGSVVRPNGVVETRRMDGLGRTLSERFSLGGRRLSETVFEYDAGNGLLRRRTEWVEDGAKGPRFATAEEVRYDKNGNAIARRSEHDASWRYFLYDGLDREIAARSPGGDEECTFFRDGVEAFSLKRFATADGGTIEVGTLSAYDEFGRLVESVPVSSEADPAPERKMVYGYDKAGRRVRERRQELTEVRTSFNTLGNAVKTAIRPLSSLHGEKTQISWTLFTPDGRIRKTTTENDALGLFGDESDAKPIFTKADQITENEYDELGRLVATTNPDGLKVSRTYNVRSLPERMVWTHPARPGKILRDLRFLFTDQGLVERIFDGATGREVARYGYDELGRCVLAEDKTGDKTVGLSRSFNGRGDAVTEAVSLPGTAFPVLSFGRDYGLGVETRAWTGLDFAGAFWAKEKRAFDAEGRARGVELDDEGFDAVEWQYAGSMPESRGVYSAHCEWSYTPMLETAEMRFSGAKDGHISYVYGPQGQTWATSVEFPDDVDRDKDYVFASYDDSDAFRRLVAQNSESRIAQDSLVRRKELLGDRLLAAKSASRTLYDQAGNAAVRYDGIKTVFAKLSRTENDPRFTSPASLIPGDGSMVGDLSVLELASNREATRAAYDGDGKLAVESRTYDLFGNVVSFQGTYWDGERRYPVDWTNRWDVLGRLEGMEAVAREDDRNGRVKKGDRLAELRFRYDASNRRVEKRVIDRIDARRPRVSTEHTLYVGNDQTLVFRVENGKDKLVGEYLWGGMERELLMAALRPVDAEDAAGREAVRYFFQQDVGMNVVRVLKDDGGISTVSTASYLGFGENATVVPIRGIRSSMTSIGEVKAFDGNLDDDAGARWSANGAAQFLSLDLDATEELSTLEIWTRSFPKNFAIYAVSRGGDLPNGGIAVARWADQNRERCVAVVQDGVYTDINGRRAAKRDSLSSPYRISLGWAEASRIVLVWFDPIREIDVSEFSVLKVPSNPAPIAFAGQWLDRETGLYYQINRYREAGSEKFLSPDPLGFFAGCNLYAYANNNPLEWHDPDGRVANLLVQAGIGAAIGAVIGGGGYALRCWLTGEEFSWREFGIQTFIGAASGAIAGLTMGAFNPWAGQVGASISQAAWHGAARGAVSGFAAGAFSGGANPLIHGVLNGDSSRDIARNTARGAGIGALSGATIGAALGAASGAYAQWNLQRSEPGSVWRVCRPDENPSKGLTPKNMADTKPLNSHITHGEYQSRFLSTTKDYKTAVKWAQQNPGTKIVKIHTSKLSNNIYDLTDQAVRNQHLKGRWALNWSKASQEVVIEGAIGPKAITEAKFLGFYF